MASVLFVITTVALFFTLSSCQAIPEVALDDSNCPVGPGVKRETILIGTNATCRCVVTKQGNSSTQAGWFRQDNTSVGVLNGTDNSSVLTFSYNPSDIYQQFECRPIPDVQNASKRVSFIPQFRRSPLIVAKQNIYLLNGDPAPKNAKNITWQVVSNGNETVNISTCNIANNSCIDVNGSLFQAYSLQSGNTTVLSIAKMRVNETQFSFVADNGLRSPIIELEIYAWPFVSLCDQSFTPTYVNFTCNIWNVYPRVIAELHREKEDFVQSDFIGNLTCSYGSYGSGYFGDYDVSCNWQIHMKSMWTKSNITVSLTAPVSNVSEIDKKPETVKTIITLTAPRVEWYAYQCDGTRYGLIKRGAQAKCICHTVSQTYAPGQARWYTNNDQVVGDENATDWTSTLTFSFNASDPNPTYTCKPFTDLQVPVEGVLYQPKFSSSMSQSSMTGLGPMIIILGALLSGIVSC